MSNNWDNGFTWLVSVTFLIELCNRSRIMDLIFEIRIPIKGSMDRDQRLMALFVLTSW